MNDADDRRDERLERLLRRWGAEEAARQAGAESLRPAAPRPGPATTVLRWLPAAAGLALALLGAALFVSSRIARPGGGESGTQGAEGTATVAQLQQLLDQRSKEFKAVRAAAAETERQLREQNDRLTREAGDLRASAEKDRAAAAEASRREAAATAALAQKQAALDVTRAAAESARSDLAALQRNFEVARTDMDNRQKELSAEVARLKEANAQCESARREAEQRLAAAREQRASLIAVLQEAYLGGQAAPGGAGLPPEALSLFLRQEAARRNHLLQRCRAVRTAATSGDARQLVDTLEVLLTRLEMVNVRSPADVAAFRRLLKSTSPAERIEDVLLSGGATPQVRDWFLEAELVLMEVTRAG